MRYFFIKRYKTLVWFSYISSAFSTVMFISHSIIDISFGRGSMYYLCLALSYVNLLCYVLNYKCLCKKGRLEKNTKNFMLGFLPVICAAVAQTIMFAWLVSTKIIKFIPLIVVFNCIFVLGLVAVMCLKYEDECTTDDLNDIDEITYDKQFDFDKSKDDK